MGLGVQPEDLDLEERLVFVEGDEVEFVCLDTVDNVSKESIILQCKVLTGEHTGKPHNIFLSKKRQYPVMIRKLREFAKAFYTETELRSGDQPLSRLYTRRFAATPLEARTVGEATYQDFHKWKDLGELVIEGATPAQQQAMATPANDIPF